MKLAVLHFKNTALVPTMLVLFVFFLPISLSLKSVFFILSLVSIVITPEYNQRLFAAYKTFWGCSALLFFLFVVLACAWSPAPWSMRLSLVDKYAKLLYLPLLAVGFIRLKTRVWCVNAYLASMSITFVLSLLKKQGIIFIGQPHDPADLFYNHIITGFMMAVASYLACLFACMTAGWRRGLYCILVVLTSYYVLFINTGRTGYLIYFILMALFLVQKCSWRQACCALGALTISFFLAYQYSAVMHRGVNQIISDVHFWQKNEHQLDTSLGVRVQLHHFAESLFRTQPLIGIGTGGFKYSYMQNPWIPSWIRLNDPHGQYWMILAEQGLIGVVLYGIFLLSMLFAAFKLNTLRPLLLGILAAFCVGSLSDTILCFSPLGYLFITLSALCLGQLMSPEH